MKNRVLALIIALMCLCGAACATEADPYYTCPRAGMCTPAPVQQVEQAEEGTFITTVGTVASNLNVDIAVLTFSVKAEGATVAEANAIALASATALRTAVKEQGVDEDDIRQTGFDVTPNVQYHNTKLTGDQVITGYNVELTLSVRIFDLNIIGKVIDAAMQTGANTAHELVYESSNTTEAYYSALAQAAQLAMKKAQLMAESCGLTLDALESIVETSTMDDGVAVVQVTYRAK